MVEVLTVVVIIALLAALILGLAGNAQKTAARKKAEAEINQLSSFVTDYRAQYGQVPADKAALKKNLSDAKHSLSNMADPWGWSMSMSGLRRRPLSIFQGGECDESE